MFDSIENSDVVKASHREYMNATVGELFEAIGLEFAESDRPATRLERAVTQELADLVREYTENPRAVYGLAGSDWTGYLGYTARAILDNEHVLEETLGMFSVELIAFLNTWEDA